MRTLRFGPATPLVFALLCGLASTPSAASSQTMEDLLEGVQRGGGWVQIPIKEGRAEVNTAPLPTMGLTFRGCLKVWEGHSGTWEVEARDALGSARIQAKVDPGQPLVFSEKAGLRSQLAATIRWSEPRDTTLLVWVGLESPQRKGETACSTPAGAI